MVPTPLVELALALFNWVVKTTKKLTNNIGYNKAINIRDTQLKLFYDFEFIDIEMILCDRII